MSILLSASTHKRGTSLALNQWWLRLLLVAVLLTLFAYLGLRHYPGTLEQEQTNSNSNSTSSALGKPNPERPIELEPGPDTLPHQSSTPKRLSYELGAQTLNDTEIDGVLKAGLDGNLIVDLQTRDFFDYFLSAADEIGAAPAILAARELMQSSLNEPARSQALNLFDRYLYYLRDQMEFDQQALQQEVHNPEDALAVLKTINQELSELQQQYFNAQELHGLFGLERANAEFTVKSMEVLANPSLSIELQREQLAQLQSELPAELQRSMTATKQQREQQIAVADVLRNSPSEAVYDDLANLGISEDKARELTAYKQQQNYFEAQYQRYRLALATKTQAQGNSDSDVDTSEALLLSFFPTPEMQTAARLRDLQQ